MHQPNTLFLSFPLGWPIRGRAGTDEENALPEGI